MDSFVLKNKSEFAKTISKSKLMERTFEKNKMAIRVNLKPKVNLIYNDIAPNKEKTKQIMSNLLRPTLSEKYFNIGKKLEKDYMNTTPNNNKKDILLNNNYINNKTIENKVSVKKPVMTMSSAARASRGAISRTGATIVEPPSRYGEPKLQ